MSCKKIKTEVLSPRELEFLERVNQAQDGRLRTSGGVDMVNTPPHYEGFKTEPIVFIDDLLESNPHITNKEAPSVYNIIKLLSRLGRKGPKEEDLLKVQYFANKLVSDSEDE